MADLVVVVGVVVVVVAFPAILIDERDGLKVGSLCVEIFEKECGDEERAEDCGGSNCDAPEGDEEVANTPPPPQPPPPTMAVLKQLTSVDANRHCRLTLLLTLPLFTLPPPPPRATSWTQEEVALLTTRLEDESSS